jgi:peptidoglycan/LPS O-acetylase OafA/YrhL
MPETSRSAAIDALRGIAILLVILLHYGWKTQALELLGAPVALRTVAAAGWNGVTLFFVLSAYLLTSQWLARLGRGPAEPMVRAYLLRRIARTGPLYLILLGLAAAVVAILPPSRLLLPEPASGHPPWAYLGVQNWVMGAADEWGLSLLAPTWSLAAEEQFYLVLPFLVLLGRPALSLAALALIPLALIARMTAWSTFGGMAAYIFTTSQMDAFAVGMLVAVVIDRGWRPGQSKATFALALGCGLLAGTWSMGWGEFSLASARLGHGLNVAAMGLLLAAILALPDRWATGAVGRVLCWLGTRCYSLYLLHQPVLILALLAGGSATYTQTHRSGLVWILIAIVVTPVLAEISFRTIEQPAIRWAGRRTSRVLGSRPPAGVSPLRLRSPDPLSVSAGRTARDRPPRI